MEDRRQITALFFDLDGTLCHTDRANYESYARAFRDEGYEITEADFYARTNGLHADAFIPMLAPGVSAETTARIRANKKHYYPETMHMVRPNRHLIEFLHFMAPQHVTALVTTAQRANAEHVLRKAGIFDVFDVKVFGDDVAQAKPHPESYLLALKLTGKVADEVITFEDSNAGIVAATAAGIRSIKVRIPDED